MAVEGASAEGVVAGTVVAGTSSPDPEAMDTTEDDSASQVSVLKRSGEYQPTPICMLSF
jgi:hypothetical protein